MHGQGIIGAQRTPSPPQVLMQQVEPLDPEHISFSSSANGKLRVSYGRISQLTAVSRRRRALGQRGRRRCSAQAGPSSRRLGEGGADEPEVGGCPLPSMPEEQAAGAAGPYCYRHQV